MRMYQTHFGFNQLPFHLTPNTALFLGLEPHFSAIRTVGAAIDMGEGLIKITGEVGTGKTLVCRMLLTHFGEDIQVVYLPNPALNGAQLQRAIATELQITSRNEDIVLDDIQQKLMALHFLGKRTVALVDEAQALSDGALEVLRLLGNLETEQDKLLQIILIGQPELDERLARRHLRQLRQRITFSAQLRALTLAETQAYIDSRLSKSGGDISLFSRHQKRALWRACRGIPRLINQVCHKALLLTFYDQRQRVGNRQLFLAIVDTFDACKPKFKTPYLWGWSQ